MKYFSINKFAKIIKKPTKGEWDDKKYKDTISS